MTEPDRGSILEHKSLAIVVMVAVILGLIGFSVWEGREDPCERWQREYEEVAAQTEGGGGVFDYVGMGPQADLEKRRPDRCPTPD